MSQELKLRRGTTAEHSLFTGANGEVTIDTEKKTVVVHDGITPGGNPLVTPAGLEAGLATRVVQVATIADLIGLSPAFEGQEVSVGGWYSKGDLGGGRFFWSSSTPKSTHNGGLVISPTVPFATLPDFLSGTGETDPSGLGCWVRESTNYVNVEFFGASGTTPALSNVAAITAALNHAPIGSNVIFNTTYPVTGTGDYIFKLTRNVNLKGAGVRRSGIRADSVGANTSILAIQITENGGFLDVRNWELDSLTIAFNGGGKHGVVFIPGGFAINTSAIRNCNISKGTHIDGGSISVETPGSAQFAHSVVELCTLSGPVKGNFADANVFRKNLILGQFTAFELDLIDGVRNNTICDNTLVTRDGALHVINGGEIRFQNNQVEQFQSYGENQSTPSASVYIEGRDRISTNIIIENNNFGGGTNVDYSVYLGNAQHCVITRNHFVPTDVADVYAAANSKFNIWEFDNTVRNSISDPRTNSLFKAEITNLSGYNIQMPLNFNGQNGWSSPTKAYYKAKDGRVVFTKPLTQGVTAPGTVVGSLAPGMWPTYVVFKYPAMDSTGVMGNVSIPGTNGVISIGSIASNGGMWIQPFQSTTDSTDF